MRTLTRFVLAAAIALAAFAPSTPAAQVEEQLWGPSAVTTDALTSAILDTSHCSEIKLFVKPVHMAGGASRVTTISCHDTIKTASAATLASYDPITATTAAGARILIGAAYLDPDAATTPAKQTGVTLIGERPCPKTKFSIAAASGTVRAWASCVRDAKR